MDLKSTLSLPDASFTIPMKAELPRMEPEMQASWDEMKVYQVIQQARFDAEPYILHDGPPYTNSPIHLGTAFNKILKDFVVKSRTMMGFRSPYVPGYDNHGLPIEQAVLQQFRDRNEQPDVLSLRKACRLHAQKYIDVQSEQFRRLGVFGLWEKPYTTMGYRFEAAILRVFRRLVEAGYVFRGLRPTLWSPTSRTALADTEIVYQDHISKAIYVRFPLESDPNKHFVRFPNFFTVIWTTTPWTIPANLALAFHPHQMYAVVKVGDAHYLLAEALVERVAEAIGWTGYEIVETMLGINLTDTVFAHPVYGRDSVAVMADYVTMEDGTGVVHTAPGHGRDDFYTGLKYGLPVLCPVDEEGVLTSEAGEFAGISYKDCDVAVVERLREQGHLLRVSDYAHSYPFAERDGKPVIFRATEQWFVAIDHDNLRQRMLEQIEDVRWIPSSGKQRITSMISGRPDWCISRQRPWGVGIPIFYGVPSGQPVLDPDAIECVARLVEEQGSDAWFSKDPKEILPEGYLHPDTGESEFRKEQDVLDVWFDSGSSSFCVFDGDVELSWEETWPPNVYLEGSDQHRGWFNTSLILAVATRGKAPYDTVVTHGFINDEDDRKMSKRLGNAVDPIVACETYGADVVRYWVASVDYTTDAPWSEALIKQVGENYRRIRNTLRFLLGNLTDFDPTAPTTPWDVDHWVLEQVELLVDDCKQKYEDFDFSAAMSAIHNFCTNELSSFYLDAIKDRMYCDGRDWPSRRAAQAACYEVLARITTLVAPVLPHTAEEVYRRIPGGRGPTVHAERFQVPSKDRLLEIEANDLEERVAVLLRVRAELFAAFEVWKQEAQLKDSQDVVATIRTSPEVRAKLESFGADLPNLLKFSWVEFAEGDPGADFRPSEFLKCERSRLRRPDVELVDGVPLSERDRRVLGL